MKTAIAFVLFLSSFALADITYTPRACTFQDYISLRDALSTKRIETGANLKNELYSVLQQEMGPKCEKLIPIKPIMGIPGNRTQTYVISTGHASYTVVDVSSVTMPDRNAIHIRKK